MRQGGGDLWCLKWFWSRAELEMAIPGSSVMCASYLFISSKFQSIFLKELGLQFPMYKLENLCVWMLFFLYSSETSGNLRAEIKVWLWLPNALGRNPNFLFCSHWKWHQTFRCWRLLSGCCGKCRKAPGTGHREFAAALGSQAGKRKNLTQQVQPSGLLPPPAAPLTSCCLWLLRLLLNSIKTNVLRFCVPLAPSPGRWKWVTF